MKTLKYICFSLLIVVFLSAILITAAWVFLDDNDYKKIITKAVKVYSGYEVSFEGGFKFDLSTEPTTQSS